MSPDRRIDITDERFKTPQNHDAIEFIRRNNPSAHSDPGDVLFKLGKSIAGAHSYCPSPATYAYVVLHTSANRIFAIAFGMQGLAFRLAPAALAAALADHGAPAPDIGADWVSFPPFNARGEVGAWDRLERWGGEAFAHARAEGDSESARNPR
ncbi:MAG TPA: hypothetical protein VGI97_06260 [Gemmatimonadaceae bacterium]|jgi:hypothetical protein